MMKKDICLIYNYAQHYRKNIFQLIDSEFLCDFYFGDKMNDVKKMDYTLLKNNIVEVINKKVLLFSWQTSVWRLIFRKEYSFFIILGQVDSLSTWLLLLLNYVFFRKKVYLWTHGWYGDETKIKKNIKKVFFFLSKGVLLYGNYAKNLMLKNGFSDSKLHVIYNSLDYDMQIILRKKLEKTNIYIDHFNNDFPNLIFIGRLDKVKRLELLIEAVSNLKKEGYFYNLTFLGNGEDKIKLIDLAERNQVGKNIFFYGACYDEQIISEYIYNADLCISPGNVGLTAIHAMTYGTPVLTHDNFSNQMPEFEAIKVGETGDFFKEDDVVSLMGKIVQNITLIKQDREIIRMNCYNVIDKCYNPHVQMQLIRKLVSNS